MLKKLFVVWVVSVLGQACSHHSNSDKSGGSSSSSSSGGLAALNTKAELGEALFNDVNLSLNRTQSCSTCHNPEHAFIDDRLDSEGHVSAVSLGDDGVSLGDRNAPTAAYTRFSPDFQIGSHARFNSQQPDYSGFLGGQFYDGRALDLAAQAGGPPLNLLEMGMPDKANVVARVTEKSEYVTAFKKLFSTTVFDDTDQAYAAMTNAIAAFEKTSVFAPFDSKYDRSLKGGYFYDPLSKAAAGKALFFSQQFTGCATCHQLQPNGNKEEVFTNFEYHNIGTPPNTEGRIAKGQSGGFIDNGLFENPEASEDSEKGKFKVPTLRNIAVTGPYMHNGVFRRLSTVIEFYDHYHTDSIHDLNPETALPWADPEVIETVALTELRDGRKLSDADVEALVCFLQTLTDTRYEHLVEDDSVDCGE